MRIFKLTTLLLALGIVSGSANAQTRSGNWCGFDKTIQQYIDNNPAALEQYFIEQQEAIKKNASVKKPPTYIIPVVVHNITHSGGVGYVSKATIDAAIDRLNVDFQRMNSDTTNTRAIFKPHAAGINIEFRLAHKDPNGDCTEGIVRLEHSSSADFSDANKGVSRWPHNDYFNIWLVDLINGSNPPNYIAGYAQFPSPTFGGGINNTYGVVVDDSFFGPNDRTLTHEIGHCFGLFHTFQSGCGGNCSVSGDGICDTPPATTATYGCNTSQNTCTNDASGPDPYNANVVDQIENYMSYDNCQNMFSAEQMAQMVSYLTSTSTTAGLAQLMTASNLTSTGTDDPYNPAICTPIADFTYNRDMICEGSTVTFTDDSWNATPTGWNWTFTGGTPSTSAVSNPTITYNTAGVYSVTHRPSTTAGQDVITKNNIITVSSLTADYNSPVTDGFENSTLFNNDWTYEGSDNLNWTRSTAASATGNASVTLTNFAASAGDEDGLISPSYDLSASAGKQIKFKVAYANKSGTTTDKLFVYYSTNCGQTWSLKLPIVNATLTTAPNHTNSFIPTSSEWKEFAMDFTGNGSATNFRLKFLFFGDGGNNIFIDDINIGGNVGVDEFSNVGNFSVFPNPTNASAKISFNLLEDVANLSVVVKNALGQEVTHIINGESFNVGKYTLNIDEQQIMSSGIYFVEFNADDNVIMKKLIVQ